MECPFSLIRRLCLVSRKTRLLHRQKPVPATFKEWREEFEKRVKLAKHLLTGLTSKATGTARRSRGTARSEPVKAGRCKQQEFTYAHYYHI